MSNQAAYLDAKGKPLRIASIEEPKPEQDEVVIKNHALAINPVDWKMRDHGYFIKEYPIILGCDVAGEIIAVGTGVKNFKAGDRIIGHSPSLVTGLSRHAAFQLHTALPVNRVAKIPSSMSFAEGVVLPLALSTAADGLYQAQKDGFLGLPYPKLKPESTGKVVVVYGGSSSVGVLTIQLAKASGAHVITLAGEKNFQFVRDAGADEVFDYKDSQVVDKVVGAVKKANGDFVGVYDAISLEDQSYHITVPILEKMGKGNLATVLPPPKNLPPGCNAGNIFAVNPSTDPVWLDFVEPALKSGQLKAVPPPVVVGKGLEALEKGMEENKKGVSAKKIVIELE